MASLDYEWRFFPECEKEYLLPEEQTTCIICETETESLIDSDNND